MDDEPVELDERSLVEEEVEPLANRQLAERMLTRDELGAEVEKRVQAVAMPLAASDPWRAFTKGVDEFLDACVEGEFQRLTVVEGPVVFGWAEWREHAEMHMLGLIKLGLVVALLATQLASFGDARLPMVLLGVVTAAAVARDLGAELDVVLVRKLRHPFQPELAIGAEADNMYIYCRDRQLLERVAAHVREAIADPRLLIAAIDHAGADLE